MYKQKTHVTKLSELNNKWRIVDAKGLKLGRLATVVANTLMGKDNPKYSPNIDTGDSVIVVNADKIELSGNKWTEKVYYRHSRFTGSLKERTAKEQLERDSTQLILMAVKGMLPKTRMGRMQLTKLRVYAGEEHKQAAQLPEVLDIA